MNPSVKMSAQQKISDVIARSNSGDVELEELSEYLNELKRMLKPLATWFRDFQSASRSISPSGMNSVLYEIAGIYEELSALDKKSFQSVEVALAPDEPRTSSELKNTAKQLKQLGDFVLTADKTLTKIFG